MLQLDNLKNQKYLVMGLARSGLSACHALVAAGHQVLAWDDNETNRQNARQAGICITDPAEIPWPRLIALVLSPGIPHQYPAPHPLAAQAHLHNIPVICDIELLFQSEKNATFIGITGTNGKSTTTALTGHLLNSLNRPLEIGGNIGVPVCDLQPLGSRGIYVLELSSYQLERVPSLDLDVAVITNITPDHLQRHGGMQGYIETKKRIFQNLGKPQTAIISMDDAYSATIAQDLSSSRKITTLITSLREETPGGIYIQENFLCDDFFENKRKMFPLPEISNLKGYHNWQNIMHAYAAARSLGVAPEDILANLKTFRNLPHRMESLGHIKTVEFINDSKATNAESTWHALAALDNIYWILGGVPKETELQGLQALYPKVRQAYTIGQATGRFAELLQDQVAVTKCYDLACAVEQAFKSAQHNHNSVVLLSPACASFDQFKDFEARGDAFRQLVDHLKSQLSRKQDLSSV